MASYELTQPLLENEEIIDGHCYENYASQEDCSSGYESSDWSDSETQLPKKSHDQAEKRTTFKETESICARVKSTHALCESLKLILDMPEMCDVTFLVGPSAIPVHGVRAILGSRSKVLYQLIIKHLRQREATIKSNKLRVRQYRNHLTIPVHRYDAEVFRMLIQFVHCGIATITDTTVTGLLCGAEQFELRDLEQACWEYIDRRVELGCWDVILSSARAYQHHRKTQDIFNTVHFMSRQSASGIHRHAGSTV